jgi:F0F1-type ATP synthase assembly protein I
MGGAGRDEPPDEPRSDGSTAAEHPEQSPSQRRPGEIQDAAWSIVSYLLSGMLVWGGVGWLVDKWTGNQALFLPIGLVLGIAAALYLVHLRFDR